MNSAGEKDCTVADYADLRSAIAAVEGGAVPKRQRIARTHRVNLDQQVQEHKIALSYAAAFALNAWPVGDPWEIARSDFQGAVAESRHAGSSTVWADDASSAAGRYLQYSWEELEGIAEIER